MAVVPKKGEKGFALHQAWTRTQKGRRRRWGDGEEINVTIT